MKTYLKSFLAMLFVLPLFLVSTDTLRYAMAAPMPDMMNGQTKVSDCLSACGSQHQTVVSSINQRESEKEKEPTTEPAEPYYLQFLQFAPVLILLSSAYLLRHLRWKPPDIYKLCAVYRI